MSSPASTPLSRRASRAPNPLRWLRRRRLAHRRRWQGRGRTLQIARRTLQIGVLALLVAIPSLSLYDSLRNQHDQIGIDARADTRAIDRLDRALGDQHGSGRWTQAVRGSVWTFKAGDLVLSDPLAVVDFVAASHRLVDRFLLTALIPLLLSVALGRVFCGWLCPADLMFELTDKVRRVAGIKTDVRFSRLTKYAVLALGIVGGIAVGSQLFAEIYPPRIVSGELYLWITFGVFGAGAWFFLAVVTFEIFVSRRFWCRYVCPGGALYSLLGRNRIVRLKVNRDACTDCRLCNASCEFGLDPMNGNFGAECNNCGLCVRSCRHDALVWRLGRPGKDGADVLERRVA